MECGGLEVGVGGGGQAGIEAGPNSTGLGKRISIMLRGVRGGEG